MKLLIPIVILALLEVSFAGAEIDMHNYMKGRHVYQSQCLPCHGRTGRGNGPWSTKLTDKPRDFRAGVFKFRTTPCGFLPTDDDLRRTIRSGINGTAMPAFTKLPEPDVTALIVYIQSMSSRWKDDKLRVESVELPKPPEWLKQPPPERLAAGRTLFANTCAACHGETGRGDGPAAKGLVSVWGYPIVPADLRRANHKSGNGSSDLYRTISLGLDGTPMVGFRGALNQQQIWELVALVESWAKVE